MNRKCFSHYTPVLDFTNAVCDDFAAAMAGRSFTEGWAEYRQWAQWLWEGSTDQLLVAVAQRSKSLGPLTRRDGETPPARSWPKLGAISTINNRA